MRHPVPMREIINKYLLSRYLCISQKRARTNTIIIKRHGTQITGNTPRFTNATD
jgi:hypothetical protein